MKKYHYFYLVLTGLLLLGNISTTKAFGGCNGGYADIAFTLHFTNPPNPQINVPSGLALGTCSTINVPSSPYVFTSITIDGTTYPVPFTGVIMPYGKVVVTISSISVLP